MLSVYGSIDTLFPGFFPAQEFVSLFPFHFPFEFPTELFSYVTPLVSLLCFDGGLPTWYLPVCSRIQM